MVLEKREKPPLASSVPSTPSEGADYIHRLETGDDPTPIDLLLVAELRGDMKAMQSVAQQAWDQTGDEASVLFNGMVAAIGQMGDWEAYQNHLAEALERRQSRGLLLDAAQIATPVWSASFGTSVPSATRGDARSYRRTPRSASRRSRDRAGAC